MTIGVIDYGGGNLRSLVRALEFLGVEPKLIQAPEQFAGVTHLAFPGQGAFGNCMHQITERGLVEPLRDWISADRPFFGICIGYQLLFERSAESPKTNGLGVFSGTVQRFRPDSGLKVPHMGWNIAKPTKSATKHPLWQGMPDGAHFYFVHSYFPEPADSTIWAAQTDYGQEFCSAIASGRVMAAQFHPEKSQEAGLALLRNFLHLPA